MKIHKSRQLKELQNEFNLIFPYLKIEFFHTPPSAGMCSNESDILHSILTIGNVQKKDTIGFMPIEGTMEVGIFEKLFEENFGLFVRVFRKSHGKWVQTWVTDIWTLEEQNNRGRVIGETDNLMAS